jgi:hypothetical protein
MATFSGTLRIVSNESFLDNGTSQILMMMRNQPPGGTPQQKIAAATAYFLGVRHLHSGDPMTVDGDIVPVGTGPQRVILVDR